MVIRTMEIGDYERVYNLWANTPGVGLNDIDDSKEGIEKYLKRNPNTCFVAESNKKIIGSILSGHDGRRGYIYHAAVLGAERELGVGTALVEAAISALEREGINKAALVVFFSNENGNRFWENRGFIKRDDLIYRNRDLRDI
ncbi:MAG: GNAT family N-acetyltransferase [Clostridia bacterium]|nr:GNAT family N-acetyltransferase [Clostridia bacterium]